MNKKISLSVVTFFTIIVIPAVFSESSSAPLIIDHTCTELSQIPDEWIDSVQSNLRMYYVHTSHGEQMVCGLERIENTDSKYDVALGYNYLPTEPDAFCIHNTLGDPDDYWYGNGITATRQVHNDNPDINISFFCWCNQLNYEGEAYVEGYLDSISMLEAEFPSVTFIYCTCMAQKNGAEGYNRYLRNERIREYCMNDDKILFDFGDLDSWWFNPATQEWEFKTYVYNDQTIPWQHFEWAGGACGHVNWASCEQKGKALWWMMAALAGWQDTVSNHPPVLDSIGPKTATEDSSLIFTVRAYDPDHDAISLSASPLPPNASFTDQRDGTGDFVFIPDSSQAGFHELCFVASDGELSDSEFVTITVINVGVEESLDEIVESMSHNLHVYPNPFTDVATVAYALPTETQVSIQVYNGYGRLVGRLCQGRQFPGYHQVKWIRGSLPSGVYMCQLRTGKFVETRKIVLID